MTTALPLYAEETAAPAPYKLASGIKSGASTVAWSPEGSRLAYITKRLYITIVGGETVKSPLRGAYFVSWLSDDSLLVLSKDKKTAFLVILTISFLLLINTSILSILVVGLAALILSLSFKKGKLKKAVTNLQIKF